jgi:hypothetical protein
MAPNTKQTPFAPLELAPIAAQLKVSSIKDAAPSEEVPTNYWDWTTGDTPTEHHDTYWNWSVNPHTAILSADSIKKNILKLPPGLELTRCF